MKILTTEQKIDKLLKGTKYNLTMLLHSYLFEWCREEQAYLWLARGQKLNWRGNGFSVDGTRPENIYFENINIKVSFFDYKKSKKKDIVKVIKGLIDRKTSFKEHIIKDFIDEYKEPEIDKQKTLTSIDHYPAQGGKLYMVVWVFDGEGYVKYYQNPELILNKNFDEIKDILHIKKSCSLFDDGIMNLINQKTTEIFINENFVKEPARNKGQ